MEGCVDLGHSAMQRRESNSRPLDHKSDVLTTTPPSNTTIAGAIIDIIDVIRLGEFRQLLKTLFFAETRRIVTSYLSTLA